jgi:hypothetical protein
MTDEPDDQEKKHLGEDVGRVMVETLLPMLDDIVEEHMLSRDVEDALSRLIVEALKEGVKLGAIEITARQEKRGTSIYPVFHFDEPDGEDGER